MYLYWILSGISVSNIPKLLNVLKCDGIKSTMLSWIYHTSKFIVDWKKFKEVIKKTKQLFLDEKIQEITSRNKRPWDLMNCIKKYKLPAIEALQFNGQLCIKLKDLWKVLHYMFNLAQNCQINSQLLNKMLVKSISK